jgi:FAD/FMN-containing dehydrogenase
VRSKPQLLSRSGNAVSGAAISRFASSFGGQVIQPLDAEYDSLRRIWNRAINRYPGLIARCASADDAVAAVNFARDNDLLVAVRGGGHSFAGKSVCDEGILIDMSRLKGITIDRAKRRASAEPGLTLGDFDQATAAQGLATTLGVAPPTGIAGLTLGGGLGWLMGRHGLACDNLVGAELITAAGEKLAIDADQNADLLWGLQGGGGNFGIVSKFEFQLHPLNSVTGGSIAYAPADRRTVLRSLRDFAAEAPDELTLQAGVTTLATGWDFGIAVCHCGDPAQAEKDLAPLRKIAKPQSDTIGPRSYLEMQSILNVPPAELSSYAKSDFLRELTDEAIDLLLESAAKTPTPTCAYILEHMHGAASRVRPTDTAFASRAAGFNLLIISMWQDPSDEASCTQWTRALAKSVEPFSRGTGYVNYLTDEGEARVKAAYGPNYERLLGLKMRYDPRNLFRLNQNITPGAA